MTICHDRRCLRKLPMRCGKIEHRCCVPRGKAIWTWVENLDQMLIHARSGPFEFGRCYSTTTTSDFGMISNCSEWRMVRENEFSCVAAGSTCCGYGASGGSVNNSAQHGSSQRGLLRYVKGNTAPLSDSCSPMRGTGLSSMAVRGISTFHLNLRYRPVRYIPTWTSRRLRPGQQCFLSV